ERGKTVLVLAHFINGQNVRMIEPRCSFGFTAETNQCLLAIRVITQNALQRDDAARVSLASAINNAHPAAADLFEDLIVAKSPIGVTHIDLPEHVLERFRIASIIAKTFMQQTGQTETTRDTGCRSAFSTRGRFFPAPGRRRNGRGVHEMLKVTGEGMERREV